MEEAQRLLKARNLPIFAPSNAIDEILVYYKETLFFAFLYLPLCSKDIYQ